jgi:hypothetical protein
MSGFKFDGTDFNDIFTYASSSIGFTNYLNTDGVDIGRRYRRISDITNIAVGHSDVKYSTNNINLATYFLPKSEQLTATVLTNYTIPPWCRTIKCLIIGAGGGGHGNYNSGGGGGGMLYVHITNNNTGSNTNLQYIVGRGGYALSTPSTGSSAGKGGDSMIKYDGSDYIAFGGNGGNSTEPGVPTEGGGYNFYGYHYMKGANGHIGGAGNGLNYNVPPLYYYNSTGFAGLPTDNVATSYGRGGGYVDDTSEGQAGTDGYIRIFLCV